MRKERVLPSSDFGGDVDGGSGGDSDIRGTCVDLARQNCWFSVEHRAQVRFQKRGKGQTFSKRK